MDHKSRNWLVLSIIGFLIWEWYYLKSTPLEQEKPEKAAVVPPLSSSSVSSSAHLSTIQSTASKTAVLHNTVADYWFASHFGGIFKIIILNHLDDNHMPITINRNSEFPIGALWNAYDMPPIGGFSMKVNKTTRSVTFTKVTKNGMRLTKRFSLFSERHKDNQYQIRLELIFQNSSAIDIYWPSYWISTGSITPIRSTDLPNYSQFNWSNGNKLASIDVGWFDGASVPILGVTTRAPAALYQKSVASVKWASVSNQYFCTVLITTPNSLGDGVWARRILLQTNPQLHGIDGRIKMPGFSVASGGTSIQSFVVYSGPKELKCLQAMGDGQENILTYGPFRMVSECLLSAMNWFHDIFGNYAWAIITLTLLIKLCLWPLQNKATRSMRQMSLLAPKITELREKYKDDPQKMNEEMMKLYRMYGINPFGGCLPMLIQIPIFFGFYSMLGTSIELRNSSFLWIRDLSQPDTLLHILGLPINPLPIVMATTMIWQMAISPKGGDVLQQRIFYFMPLIFLAFCYNYASGLALYWTTQNIFSIIQIHLTRNQPLPQPKVMKHYSSWKG